MDTLEAGAIAREKKQRVSNGDVGFGADGDGDVEKGRGDTGMCFEGRSFGFGSKVTDC